MLQRSLVASLFLFWDDEDDDELISAAPPVPATTGAGGSAPRKYWGDQETNMRNAFMIRKAIEYNVARVDYVERAKLAAAVALLLEDEYD